MPLVLPPRPNLEQLRKQAKDLLKAHHAQDPAACSVLRQLYRFRGKDDTQIIAAAPPPLTLTEVQLALALEYGFESWAHLKAHLEPQERSVPTLHREDSRVWLDHVLDAPIGSGRHRQLLGLRTLLHAHGIRASLDDLLVCGGNPFCFSHPNLWHEIVRLAIPTDFMHNAAAAFGCELRWRMTPFCDSMAEYEPLTHAALDEIRAQIDKGIPVLVGGVTAYGCGTWSVAVGYDSQRPQLAHMGLTPGIQWMDIRGIAFPCNAAEGLDKHWNAQLYWNPQIQMPRNAVYTGCWRVNPFATLEGGHAVDRRDRVLRTFRLAVDLYHHAPKPVSDKARYQYGQLAFERAASDFETVPLARLLETSPWEIACRISMLCDQVAWLRDDRRVAAAFCRQAAADGLLRPAALLEAAAFYDRLSERIAQVFSELPDAPREKRDDGSTGGEATQQWYADASNRQAAAQAYRDAAQYERQAVLAIENALKS
ncbi:MAG: hypothetical protein FWD53_08825 [Phycisphaerales bacterium]|nr:hypothetical protein [Phycisphaerales bacterium]